ncbi:toxin co-regulated pilus biosynthesis Q family protein [Paraburkholderia sp. BCC1885]|uniref:toxin co-regulated pilus biosynthesis Q family protein n=1 Tax=Paraburkholderia sp. BCC1885 TaxID=2562669 RepID=UPI001642CE59|nr:toxin co-regulated pilus biosynthesis Q family protein [Paraburkholderia sp. BCC1885]
MTAVSAASEPGFALQAGQSLQAQLQSWATDAGWTVVWTSPDDWVVPGGQRYAGPFADAARQVIEALALDGADIRADLYMGNRTLVVHVAGEDE